MEQESKVKEKSSLKSFLTGLGIYVLLIAIMLVCCLFMIRFISNNYLYVPVEGTSMQPTINKNPVEILDENGSPEYYQDGVFIKVTKDVTYNDIIIIQEDPNSDKTIIKRVIATNGDMLTILIDDFTDQADNLLHTFIIYKGTDEVVRLDESYLDEQDLQNWSRSYYRPNKSQLLDSSPDLSYEPHLFINYLSGQQPHLLNGAPRGEVVTHEINGKVALFYKLSNDEIFFMGDHRSVSSDARMRGSVVHNKVVGKVVDFLRDAQEYKENGTLWWARITHLFNYYWGKTENYFAW